MMANSHQGRNCCTDSDPPHANVAIKSGHGACLRRIIKEKPKTIDDEDARGYTPLLAAIDTDNYDMVEAVIGLDADVNKVSCIQENGFCPRPNKRKKGCGKKKTERKDGCTPLQLASDKGFSRAFFLLLENGAKLDFSEAESNAMDANLVMKYFDTYCMCQSGENSLHLNFKVLSSGIEESSENKNKNKNEKQDQQALPGVPLTIEMEPLNTEQRVPQEHLDEKLRINKHFFMSLVNYPSNKSLCQHPFITAFLEIHYSVLFKLWHESRECVPQLALMLILLEFVSVISDRHDFLFDGGDGHGKHNYISKLAFVVGTLLALLDIITFIAKKWLGIEKWLGLGEWKINRLHNEKPFYKSFQRILDLAIHLVGYVVIILTVRSNLWTSVANGWSWPSEDPSYSQEKAHRRLKLLHSIVFIYVPLLIAKECTQIHNCIVCNHAILYLKQWSNYIDWVAITTTLVASIATLSYGFPFLDVKWYLKPLNMIAALVIWFGFCGNVLECLRIPKVEEYKSMLYHVARTYLKITMAFSLYFVGFTATFMALTKTQHQTKVTEDVFAGHFLEALIKTFQMFIGEVDYNDLVIGEYDTHWPCVSNVNDTSVSWPHWLNETFQCAGEMNDMDRNNTRDEYFRKYNGLSVKLGWSLFAGFVFLFVIVLTNLLNAIAIGDIKHLRQNSVASTNKKKILDLLEQDPHFTDCYYTFEHVQRPAERRVKNFWKYTWLMTKGKIGRPDKGGERFRGAISARDQKNKPTFGGVASAISAKDKFKTTSTLAAQGDTTKRYSEIMSKGITDEELQRSLLPKVFLTAEVMTELIARVKMPKRDSIAEKDDGIEQGKKLSKIETDVHAMKEDIAKLLDQHEKTQEQSENIEKVRVKMSKKDSIPAKDEEIEQGKKLNKIEADVNAMKEDIAKLLDQHKKTQEQSENIVRALELLMKKPAEE